ncbi:MAG: transcription-repair coupling factor [Peptoniphilus harei]|uniref:transcription-repair coupling factor n=1 Tax=Peptoniphilus harei TaxID=54005 RepID=UPI0025511BF6|nr:transcription-repair coupling factor [Peptoniphilus harei]MDK7754254.1 transcription-repair coupling factor [Peptoniphilus harei]MDK7760059.1 transcription-repair coupling factor [Peptoniphilus harei]MDK8271616.1 transcription-repair coupling factor [Peptoniphilus harei]MDK8340086.1 transcription-repair coupling factor [Peptoniphilus harei]MDU7532874.1 transcription-repair coupling factor [Peptoniphilus harei]
MNFLINSVKNLEAFKELDNSIKISKNTAVFGSEEAVLSLFAPTFAADGKKVCLISQDRVRARKAYEDIESISDEACVYYPEKDVFFYDRDSKSKENTKKRLEAMAEISSGRAKMVVTTLNALTAKISRPEIFSSYKTSIEVGQVLNLDDLPKKLVEMGYERFPSVEGLGQFSLRGSIIDIGTQDANYRIELFDDEVDSIRSFEIESQRSIEKLEKITIYPIEDLIIKADERDQVAERIKKDLSKIKLQGKEKDRLNEKFLRYVDRLENQETIINKDLILPYVDQEEVGSFLDYLDDFIFLIEEPSRILEREEELDLANGEKFAILIENGEVTKSHEKTFYNYKDIVEKLNEKTLITFNALLKPPKMFKPKDIVNIKVKSVTNYMSKMKLFKEDLDYYGKNNFQVILLGATEKRAKRLFDHLVDLGYSPHLAKNTKNEKITSNIVVTTGALNEGIEFSDSKTVFINYSEIYGSFSKKKKKKPAKKKALNFEDLQIGDYVVHEAHGVGKYVGTRRLEVSGIQKDYILIEYGGEDKLFLPIEALDSIYKYVQEGKRPPKVNKLNSLDWKKKKARARQSIDDMADELIKLYATRENTRGFAFSEDSQYQREFEDAFIYEETSGQLKSAEEIKEDMERPSPMDRLLCADVGYGKTEVALRAAFKAILDGKQVAILVPTTILAQQHYNTIKERFKNFPVGVGLLSRFRSKKDQKMDLEGLKDGNIDIIVGTHRLLSKDVKFKDLGLLIIDEEQRFGVRHKEKLRMLKENVDTLTLTATPIPRTLQMSMIGIRDMSVIEEPPEERFPVETYVLEYNNLMVREAILKEIERGGQVYFLYNKVSNMENKLLELRKLVPEATFSMANGQMTEKALEDTMIDFIEGNVDVLVCSTIIETGMDVPNANTMIITDSNRLGLSQLYQLRGRIGRSSRIAYAYFTYDRSTSISEVAQKRLQAIKEFTEFGSGHKIAERDLEIRGSGSILGSRQSGHIEKIGYDLYMKYLKDAVMKLKGLDVEEEIETTIDLKLDSFIPKEYIADDRTRLEIYKKISVLSTEEEYSDLVDELIDRFSDFPDEVSNLMDIALLKNKAQKAKVSSIVERRGEYRVRVEGEVGLPAIMEINNEFDNVSYSMGNVNEIVLTKLKYPLDELKKLVTILYLHKKDTKTSKK